MARATGAGVARPLLVAAGVAAVLAVVVRAGAAAGSAVPPVLWPVAAAAVAAAGLHLVLPRLARTAAHGAGGRAVTPYSALAEAGRRIRSGSLEQALPGLAQVVAEGTGATRTVVWLAIGERLVEAARYPPDRDRPGPLGGTVPDLAVLLASPDTDHVVPVLDGTVLRAALAIRKPAAVTVADRRLMQDVANGAGLLLRVVGLNVELAERVQRAADLAKELQASRRRLTSARDSERRRLVAELGYATGDRLDALRAEVAAAAAGLAASGPPGADPDPAPVHQALARARAQLDDLLERFRAVARGVYPAVLRDHGPAAALDEVIADLPRTVRFDAGPGQRLPWELESGIYYAAATALRALAGRPDPTELVLRLDRAGSRITVRLEDPAPPISARRLGAVLADDADRLAALGGALRIDVGTAATGERIRAGADDTVPGVLDPFVLHAWLPDRVEPVVVDTAGTEVTVR